MKTGDKVRVIKDTRGRYLPRFDRFANGIVEVGDILEVVDDGGDYHLFFYRYQPPDPMNFPTCCVWTMEKDLVEVVADEARQTKHLGDTGLIRESRNYRAGDHVRIIKDAMVGGLFGDRVMAGTHWSVVKDHGEDVSVGFPYSYFCVPKSLVEPSHTCTCTPDRLLNNGGHCECGAVVARIWRW